LAAKKTIDVFLNTFHFQGAIITYLYPLALFLNFSHRDPKDNTLNLNLENILGATLNKRRRDKTESIREETQQPNTYILDNQCSYRAQTNTTTIS
jgi:hypothetical protein